MGVSASALRPVCLSAVPNAFQHSPCRGRRVVRSCASGTASAYRPSATSAISPSICCWIVSRRSAKASVASPSEPSSRSLRQHLPGDFNLAGTDQPIDVTQPVLTLGWGGFQRRLEVREAGKRPFCPQRQHPQIMVRLRVFRLGQKNGAVEPFGVLQPTLAVVHDRLLQGLVDGQCACLLRRFSVVHDGFHSSIRPTVPDGRLIFTKGGMLAQRANSENAQ